MTRYAVTTLIPCTALGIPESGRRIDPGDRLEIGVRINGVWPCVYPVPGGKRAAFLRSLVGTAAVFNQNRYPTAPYPAPGYEKATIKSGGCGPTAAAICLETLKPGFGWDPVRMAAFARACGARVPGGTDMEVLCKRLGERAGLSIAATNAVSDLIAHLRRGGVAVCNVAGKKDIFSTEGHYMAVLGEENGTLRIADPGYYARKFGPKHPQREGVRVCGSGDLVILSCAPALLDEDCAGRFPRYCLLKD